MKHGVALGLVSCALVACAAHSAPQPDRSDASRRSALPEPRACRFGELAACEQACTRGEALSCNNLGAMYELGSGVEIDRDRARALYRQACFAHAADEACANLLRVWPDPVPEPRATGAADGRERCTHGDEDACRGLPGIHVSGNVQINGNVTIFGDVYLYGR